MQTVSAVLDATGKTQSYVALFSDVTSVNLHQQQLERMAHYDPLTGLPKHLLLADRLNQAMYQAKQGGRNQWRHFDVDADYDSDGVSNRSHFSRL